MAAFIALSGEPFCADCRYSLRGCARRGRCPECGGHYYLNLPVREPGLRALLRELRSAAHPRNRRGLSLPSLQTLSIALLITGASALTVYFALLALDIVYQAAGAGSLFDHFF